MKRIAQDGKLLLKFVRNMKKKLSSIFIISIFAIAIFGTSFAFFGKAASEPLPEPMLLGSDFFGEREINVAELTEELELPLDSSTPSASSSEGDVQYWLVYDDVYGYLFPEAYILIYAGVYCEVWVKLDLNYYIGPNYLTGDDTTQDLRAADVITPEQANYMGMEYDLNIHETMVNYFGEPAPHYGESGSGPRIMGRLFFS